MHKRRGLKPEKPSIGEHLQECENRNKYALPIEAKIAWAMLIAIALAKYFLTI